MQLRDEATLALRMESNEFDRTLNTLNEKAKVLKNTLKDIERDGGKDSAEWAKYKTELTETEAAAKKVVSQMKQMDIGSMTMQQLINHSKQLQRELKGMERDTIGYVETAKRLGEVEREMKKATDETIKLKQGGEDLAKPTMWQKITGGVNSIGGAFKAMMALQVIGYIIEIGRTIFEATAKMEKFEKVLTTALGDNRLAKESLAAIKQMAKDTVFTVEELTDGYVKMINRGLRPSQQEMVALADLAASQGKTFDQLVEGLLDAGTAEFERLKEFGTRASKAGDQVTFSFKDAQLELVNTGKGFDVMDKATGKVINTFKNQEDATMGVLTALGTMQGVAGQNADMMTTLDGRTSNLQDSFFDLAANLGEDLRPAFIAIFDLINALLPVLSVLGKIIATIIIAGKGLISSFIETLTSAWSGITSLFEAGKELLNGNLNGAKKAYQDAKKYGDEMLNAATKNGEETRNQIKAIWSDKDAGIAAEFAGKDQGQKYQSSMTNEQEKGIKEREKEADKARKKEEAEQEKHNEELVKQEKKRLEDTKKANEDALAETLKLEDEAFVAKIKIAEGEFEAEKVILQQKLDNQLEKLEESLANEEQKEKLRKLLIEKYVREIAIIEEKARKKTEEDEEKSAQELHKINLKRLDNEKKVLKLEENALKDILRFKEIENQRSFRKVADARREHANEMLLLTKRQLENQRAIEEAKIIAEIKDEKERTAALKTLNEKHRADEIKAERETAAAKNKIDEDLHKNRFANAQNLSNAFKSLLKGDFNNFIDHLQKMNLGETAEWQKRLQKQLKFAGLLADAAVEAVNFLAELAIQRTESEIREVERAWKHREKLLDAELEKATEIMEEVMERRDRIAEETGEKVTTTKEREAEKLKNLDELMATVAVDNSNLERDQKIANAEAVLAAEIAAIEANANFDAEKKAEMIAAATEKSRKEIELARSEADEKKAIYAETIAEIVAEAEKEKNEKITKAEATRDAVLTAIEWERSEKVIASEAIRDAQIKNIQERQDLDDATRAKMIEDLKAAAIIEIEKANEVATEKNRNANEIADTAISEAKREEIDKVAITEALVAGDKAKAETIMAQAEVEATEKIAQAERERIEKLQIVEAEKADKIAQKQELERQLWEEQKAAKMRVWELEVKMFRAQQKADLATARIQAALAALKSLASAPFPFNLIAVAGVAAASLIQTNAIKNQTPPEMPEFKYGGIIRGGRHGSSYGLGGIAMIDRQTNREVGEMEGEEYIVPADQTALNLPFLQEMSRRSRAGVREPIESFRAFKHGGFVNYPMWKKQMFLYGGQAIYSNDTESNSGSNDFEFAPGIASEYKAAIETGNQQLDYIRSMNEGIGMLNDKLNQVIGNTEATVAATRSVEEAIYATNTNNKIDTLIGAISNLGKAA